MNRTIQGTLIVAMLALAGCMSSAVHQAYAGAPLPPEETCVLAVPALLDVVAIDGAPMERMLRVKTGSEQRLSLLPGDHLLQVRYYDPTADESRHELYMAGPVLVRFKAAARGAYALQFETSRENPSLKHTPEKFRAWVDDGLQAAGTTAPTLLGPAPAGPTTPAKSVLLDK